MRLTSLPNLVRSHLHSLSSFFGLRKRYNVFISISRKISPFRTVEEHNSLAQLYNFARETFMNSIILFSKFVVFHNHFVSLWLRFRKMEK